MDELRQQVDRRDDVVKHVETLNQRNMDEYVRAMQDIKNEKENNETQTSIHMRALQENIEQQTKELEEFREGKITSDQKLLQMSQQMELNIKVVREAEERADRLQEENQKLYSNYDVLKEHELNIIKDFQDKKISA